MNVTLSIDEKLLSEAREVATQMGKSLNQLICESLEQMTQHQKSGVDFEELVSLSGQGDRKGWTFDRDDLHERA